MPEYDETLPAMPCLWCFFERAKRDKKWRLSHLYKRRCAFRERVRMILINEFLIDKSKCHFNVLVINRSFNYQYTVVPLSENTSRYFRRVPDLAENIGVICGEIPD